MAAWGGMWLSGCDITHTTPTQSHRPPPSHSHTHLTGIFESHHWRRSLRSGLTGSHPIFFCLKFLFPSGITSSVLSSITKFLQRMLYIISQCTEVTVPSSHSSGDPLLRSKMLVSLVLTICKRYSSSRKTATPTRKE